MLNYRNVVFVAAALAAVLPAFAAVTAEEAVKLKSTLTPLGAERAGNKDGSIPAWEGAYLKPLPGAAEGKHGDPFPSEKPLLQITEKNFSQYADKLSEGTLALLKKYPTFRIDVYPTHRTAGAPQWVYDNTFKAATSAKLTPDGMSFTGAWGAVPFPIPKNGNEVMWNHLVHPRPAASQLNFRVLVGASDGSRTLATEGVLDELWTYYQKDGNAEKFKDTYAFIRFNTTAPAYKAGEAVLVHESLDMSKEPQAWQYMVGQRRVRRAPTVSYDTPDFMVSGTSYFDELQGLRSRLDRYDWKLVGKQEMYVPYNTNRFFGVPEEQAFVPHHPNPEHVRWELHRVWVVEATVAQGKRHAVPKRRFYIDEDSWTVLLADGYDAEGKLWRTTQVFNRVMPEAEMHAANTTFVYNLQAGTLAAIQLPETWKVVPGRPLSYYSTDALAADSAR
ncbi:MAG: DUF1329 domain-containing protein [Thauera sp.]|jgi:hypothetical protein|nr:DUF1329 domain-containing protein [Thauera sp.]